MICIEKSENSNEIFLMAIKKLFQKLFQKRQEKELKIIQKSDLHKHIGIGTIINGI